MNGIIRKIFIRKPAVIRGKCAPTCRATWRKASMAAMNVTCLQNAKKDFMSTTLIRSRTFSGTILTRDLRSWRTIMIAESEGKRQHDDDGYESVDSMSFYGKYGKTGV